MRVTISQESKGPLPFDENNPTQIYFPETQTVVEIEGLAGAAFCIGCGGLLAWCIWLLTRAIILGIIS